MAEWLSSIGVLGLVGVGLGALALSQPGHWRKVMRRAPCPQPRALRRGAWLALSLGLLLSLVTQGAGLGTVFWVLSFLPAGSGVAIALHLWRA